MFEWLKNRLKFSALASHWQELTGLELTDSGLIIHQAGELMCQHALPVEDAWLMALASWVDTCKPASDRRVLARAVLHFMQHNRQFRFDEEASSTAMLVAQQIINEGRG